MPGMPSSQTHQASRSTAAPSVAGVGRPVQAGQGGRGPPGVEPAEGGAAADAVGPAAGRRPGHPGHGRGRRDPAQPVPGVAEGGHRLGRAAGDHQRPRLAARLRGPDLDQVGQGPGDVGPVQDRARLGPAGHHLHRLGARVGDLALVGPVGGQRVGRLPGGQDQRQLQHLGVGAGGAAQVLAAQDPLLGDGAGHRRHGQVRGQLGERCGWWPPPRSAARGRTGPPPAGARWPPPGPARPGPSGTRRRWSPATAGVPAPPPPPAGAAGRPARPSRGWRTARRRPAAARPGPRAPPARPAAPRAVDPPRGLLPDDRTRHLATGPGMTL